MRGNKKLSDLQQAISTWKSRRRRQAARLVQEAPRQERQRRTDVSHGREQARRGRRPAAAVEEPAAGPRPEGGPSSARPARSPGGSGCAATARCILMTLPALGLLLLFNYLPLLGNVVAFQDYDPYSSTTASPRSCTAPGSASSSSSACSTTRTSGTRCRTPWCCSSLQLVLFFPIPIALALLINSVIRPRVRAVSQAIMYLPHFFSWVLVVTVFQQIFGGAGHHRADPASSTAATAST